MWRRAGAMMKDAGKRHAMAAALKDTIAVKDSTLVVQYEIKASEGVSCDGAYIKLLQKEAVADLKKFDNTARYTIMFGPDKCGGNDKVHFILQHQNPVSKEWEEKHANDMPVSHLGDRKTHLYTLIVRPDNSFEVLIDNVSKKKGSLLSDMTPPVNPEKVIDDPDDKKPSDWVDLAQIEDPAATKPDDWDETLPEYIPDEKASKPAGWEDNEPLQVPDPAATKPADWDDEEDGDWEAPIVDNPKCKVGCGEWKRPTIRNPDYKGKWFPPLIDNPDYKGPWAPRKIENKNYFVDEHPHNMHPISAVGFELLTVSGGIVFDNILLTDSETAAKTYADKTWSVRNAAEKSATGEDGLAASATKGASPRACAFLPPLVHRLAAGASEHATPAKRRTMKDTLWEVRGLTRGWPIQQHSGAEHAGDAGGSAARVAARLCWHCWRVCGGLVRLAVHVLSGTGTCAEKERRQEGERQGQGRGEEDGRACGGRRRRR